MADHDDQVQAARIDAYIELVRAGVAMTRAVRSTKPGQEPVGEAVTALTLAGEVARFFAPTDAGTAIVAAVAAAQRFATVTAANSPTSQIVQQAAAGFVDLLADARTALRDDLGLE